MPRSPADWVGTHSETTADAIVAAMALGEVDYLFFSSGSEVVFFQEAIAKARAQGRRAPKL